MSELFRINEEKLILNLIEELRILSLVDPCIKKYLRKNLGLDDAVVSTFLLETNLICCANETKNSKTAWICRLLFDYVCDMDAYQPELKRYFLNA